MPEWVPEPIRKGMKEWNGLNMAAAKRNALGDLLGYPRDFQKEIALFLDKVLADAADIERWENMPPEVRQAFLPQLEEKKESLQWLEDRLAKLAGDDGAVADDERQNEIQSLGTEDLQAASQSKQEETSKQKQDEELTKYAVGGILPKKQGGRRFPSEELLTRHHKKHMKQFGEISVEEYLDLANALIDRPLSDDVVQLVRSDGSISKYCFSTNEFVVVDPDGTIKTFFRPENGRRYWEHELDRNK